MTAPSFTFTRAPGTKTSTAVQQSLVGSANNTLVLIGHVATTGATATLDQPYTVINFGNAALALTECATQFGAGSEIGGMVVAAINGIQQSTLSNISYPPIVCIPLAHGDTSANLSAVLSALIAVPMPYVASPYAGTDSVGLLALNGFLNTIGAQDRGRLGQFGSFGFVGIVDTYANASTVGLAQTTQQLSFPWMIDSATTKANTAANIAAAVAALNAANARPYNPLTDIVVGGVAAQVSSSDWHTLGDTGTEALGLAAGLVPLMTNANGTVAVSRAITSYAPVAGSQASAYFDIADWQCLYDYRQQAYVRSQLPQYKNTKGSDQVAGALNSDLINIAKLFEQLGMFQYVDKLAGQFTYSRSLSNRAAFVYSCPVNVVPGFMNKGIAINGTTQFDVVV